MFTRSGFDWTARFPTLAKDLAQLPVASGYIDGALCALDERGASDFGTLQAAIGAKRDRDLIFYVFDLLQLDGADLRRRPQRERRELLRQLVLGKGRKKWSHVQFSEAIDADPHAFFKLACKEGLEGIISKKAEAPYVSRRSDAWLKIKCAPREDFVIGGYVQSSAGKGIGSLLLGHYEGKDLVYDGRAGTGFTEASSIAVEDQLRPLIVKQAVLQRVRREHASRAVWVKPELVCEVKFTARTAESYLRQASFKGLREDKRPEEVGGTK